MDSFQNLSGFTDLLFVVEEKVAERSAILTFGSAILFIVVAISFLTTKRMGTDTAFGFSSFMGFLTAFFLLYLGMIQMGVFVFMTLLLFISTVFLIYKKREKRG